ncbi:hypothetical protein PgNI_05241 [Pyricularia grisea]|uniref:Uncharacterized protein n=1 Tax=Pyricularia grisea TaxID=148305 RepID=A0A6P8B721_PYRGI|nr:hypothetical protein PgNI_05241 [Pyricularia grisea]TLD11112.1 hypothetical protein PgNI_05241 [Pyricularia grisea]
MTDDCGFFPNQPWEHTSTLCSEKPCPRSSFDLDEWPQVREPFPAGLHVCRQSRSIILDALKRRRTKKRRERKKEWRQKQQQQQQQEEKDKKQGYHYNQPPATLRPFLPNMDILYLDMGAAPARYHRRKASRKAWEDRSRTHLFEVIQGQRRTYLSEVTKLALPFGMFSPEYPHMQHVVCGILALLPIQELHVVFDRSIWSDQGFRGWHDDEDEDDDCEDTSSVSSLTSSLISSPISRPISPYPSPPVSWTISPPKTPQLNQMLDASKLKSWMAACWPQGHQGAALKSEGVLGILSNGIVVKPGLLVRSTGWE